MKKSFFNLTILFLFIFSSYSFSQYKKMVDGDHINKIIATLCSKEYQGRESGLKGCEMAEDFFADQFKAIGLKPLGDNGTFFNNYTLQFYKIEGKVTLLINERKYYYGRNEDFRLEPNSDGGNISGEIVFAGYGINSKTRNDFDGIDLKNKIVLIKKGCPNNDWAKWKDYAIDSIKAEYCYKNGAIGILFFEPTYLSGQIPPPGFPNSLSFTNRLKNFPIFRVDERVARYILDGSSSNLNTVNRNLDAKTLSCNINKIGKMNANVVFDYARKARNILGMIEGTDSKLKNEAIIIGGHLDHLGIDNEGKINFGADDNASGPSVALGVAKAMMKNKFKSKRTIIFAAWTGEEKGLLGSYAWCGKPSWDLNKVVVYFNLDMVGLGDGKLNFPGIYYSEKVWNFLKENSDTSYLNKVIPSKGGLGGSDHNPFLQKGVPAFAGMTSGPHPDYHTPGDSPEKIVPSILQFVGDWMYHCIDILGNSKNNFIDPERNVNNKMKLASFLNLAPINYSELKSKLTDKSLNLSLVNFSEVIQSESPSDNFVKALHSINDAIKKNPTEKEYSIIQNPNEIRMNAYQNKLSLIASCDIGFFAYDEAFCKALSKAGIKVGIIQRNSPFGKSDFDKDKTLNNILNSGIVGILNKLEASEISNILKQTDRPVGIIVKNIDDLNEELIKIIKEKGHLVILEFNNIQKTDDLVKVLESAKEKIGVDNLSFDFSVFEEESMSKLKDLFKSFDKKYSDSDIFTKISYSSFINLITKGLQERPTQVFSGRPF